MSVTTAHNAVVLEPASQAFVEATAEPPFLYELTPGRGARRCSTTSRPRRSTSCPSTSDWITVPADVGDVRVRIVRPAGRRRARCR